MVRNATDRLAADPQYIGMRCSADEYLNLADDGFDYQLIDGVVIMSPKPAPEHQDVYAEIIFQLKAHILKVRQGRVLPDVDVRLALDLVYSPDVAYLAPGRIVNPKKPLTIAPDLVVEIVSPSSRRMDLKTKRADYEKFGVREYWVFEPDDKRVRVFRLRDGAFIETVCEGPSAPSEVIPGFAFDLPAVWASMQP